MNASASASSLNWRPTVRRRVAAGRSSGAGPRAAPSKHLAVVADSLPAPPQAARAAPSSLAKPKFGPLSRFTPSCPAPSIPVQNPFRRGSPFQPGPRPAQSNPVKVSQAWRCRPAPQAPDPRPQTPDPKPQTPDPRPQTQNPRPKTPDPKPQTQNPKPENKVGF